MMVLMDSRRMCPHCRAFITTKDKVCPYCNERVGPRAVERDDGGTLLGGLIPQARFLTVIILVINFGLYAATTIYAMRRANGELVSSIDMGTLISFGAKLPPAFLRMYRLGNQWWRLVTAGFLHGGLMHILMNSWSFMSLGPLVEEIFGGSRMLVIYFCSTVSGYFLSYMLSDSVSIGASAAIFGLIGAMIAISIKEPVRFGHMRRTFVGWAMFGVIYIFGNFFGMRIDNYAHFGGLAGGFAVAYLAGTPRLVQGWTERLWQFSAWACIAITAVSFLNMYLWFSRLAQ
jgi:rhomboid protease GluP